MKTAHRVERSVWPTRGCRVPAPEWRKNDLGPWMLRPYMNIGAGGFETARGGRAMIVTARPPAS